jgi:hypothetical protein
LVALVLFYALTLFTSALLLFLVQPMVGKMTLPMLGGTPAVWNTCMVFFQALLLAGYAYAHAATRLLGARKQAGLHLLVLALPFALMTLPIAVPDTVSPPTGDNPMGWLLGRLFVWVGVPFFVVSTTAPLLQMWFSSTGHVRARDPYFLYTASNAGSLIALFAYPLVLEPLFDVETQSLGWAIGYGLLSLLILLCAVTMWKSATAVAPVAVVEEAIAATHVGAQRPVTWGRRLWWIVLALIPSSLMLGATTHITTNLAPGPLLWVLPLALYLLTFIIVFSRKPILSHSLMVRALPILILIPALLAVSELGLGKATIPLHMIGFFAAAMVCHGELAEDRPATSHLTEFYLLMSVGGVLGGLLNAVVAPLVFTTIAEYPLMIAAACLVTVKGRFRTGTPLARGLDFAAPVALTLLTVGAVFVYLRVTGAEAYAHSQEAFFLVVGLPMLLTLLLANRPLRFGLGLAGVMAVGAYLSASGDGEILHRSRNFYGVKTIARACQGTDCAHMFFHGTTMHGYQRQDPAGRTEPMAYFHRKGPIGDVFREYCEREPRVRNVAIVGLAAGSMAAYGQLGQHFTFYEIDPAVAEIAEDPNLFTFLADCRAEHTVVVGDGRLTIADSPEEHFGLIVLDAFSSDAVPTHLLTREAVRLYKSRLAPGGAIVFNCTNNYLDLVGLLGNVAAEEGLVAKVRNDLRLDESALREGRSPSRFVIMARTQDDFRRIARDDKWADLPRDPSAPTWTDRFSNIISLLLSPKPIGG